MRTPKLKCDFNNGDFTLGGVSALRQTISNLLLSIIQLGRETKEVAYFNSSSHQKCSMQKEVPRNFTKFTRKHLCQSLFFNKVTGLRSVTLLKKRNWHRYIPVKFVKFLRTPFYRTLLDDCFYIKLSSLLLLVPIKTTQ